MKVESRHTFSINLPTSLYQKVLDRAGRGRISTFIKEILEKMLTAEEKNQKEKLIAGYQKRANNKDLQSMLRAYGEMSWEDVSVGLNKQKKKNE